MNRLIESNIRPIIQGIFAALALFGALPDGWVEAHGEQLIGGIVALWTLITVTRNRQSQPPPPPQ